MKCVECNLWGADYYGDFPYCHADPNWPAPCEYDDDYDKEEEDDPCIGCPHEGFGSEHCAAGIGDYCRAGQCVIEE